MALHRKRPCRVCLRLNWTRLKRGRPFCPERRIHVDPDLPRWCVAFKQYEQLTLQEAQP